MQVARQRCGDAVADALMPSTVLVEVKERLQVLSGERSLQSGRRKVVNPASGSSAFPYKNH
jgi:hypothetical protein